MIGGTRQGKDNQNNGADFFRSFTLLKTEKTISSVRAEFSSAFWRQKFCSRMLRGFLHESGSNTCRNS
jgi:hypothetical protein